MRYVIIIASYPFVVLGFIWQFVAGSFYAGRIVSSQWMARRALARLQQEIAKTPSAVTGQQATLGKGLH